LDRRIYETKFPTYVSFVPSPDPPFYISLITLTFLSTLKTFCWWL